jgi:phosphoribosylformylglycinamidine synthase PurS subunit
MIVATINVKLKEGVLDPQGTATKNLLKHMGFEAVKDVNFGKLIQVVLDTDDREAAQAQVAEMCKKLLVNPVLEDCQYEIVEV